MALTVGTFGLGLAAVVGVVHLLDSRPTVSQCAAAVDGTSRALAPDQADNAALIAATTVRRGLPARAATIGLATAIQESKLRNLDYGHADSLGLFQQRPSQGWGTAEQVTDPVYATGLFFDHLVRVPDWEDLPVTEAAQAVQRSAYPDAYADHESAARAWASGLTGYSPAAVTCTLTDPDGSGSTKALEARLVRDLGELPVEVVEPGVFVVDAQTLDPAQADRMAWAVGQWAVAVADTQQIVTVQVGDQRWTRDGTWTTADDPAAPGTVRITIA
jgi:hypothetical protein